jgi:hypothetical protein
MMAWWQGGGGTRCVGSYIVEVLRQDLLCASMLPSNTARGKSGLLKLDSWKIMISVSFLHFPKFRFPVVWY